MAETLKTYTYNPSRQGVDTNSWRILSGTPAVDANGRIKVYTESGASTTMIGLADFVKGEISMDIVIPTEPAASDFRVFGVASSDLNNYIYFIVDNGLFCEIGNAGITSYSDEISWDSDWTGSSVNFGIRWEAGTAKFFVDGVQVYAVSDESVPYGPLCFVLRDKSTESMLVGALTVKGTQSLEVNIKSSDTTAIEIGGISTSPSYSPSTSPSVSISPSISPSISNSASPSISPSISPSVSPSVSISPSISPSVSPSVSISPSISPSVSPSVSVSPSISPSVSPSISISPSVSPSISPSVSVSPSGSVSPSASPSASPSVSPSISPSVSPSPSF